MQNYLLQEKVFLLLGTWAVVESCWRGMLAVFQNFTNSSEDLSLNGIILQDVFYYASWFVRFRSNFAPRCCNNVPDTLAEHGRNTSCEIWSEDPPEFLVPCVVADFEN